MLSRCETYFKERVKIQLVHRIIAKVSAAPHLFLVTSKWRKHSKRSEDQKLEMCLTATFE